MQADPSVPPVPATLLTAQRVRQDATRTARLAHACGPVPPHARLAPDDGAFNSAAARALTKWKDG